MYGMRRRLSLLVLVLAAARWSPAAEIAWDTYGVPHIFAQQPAELFRAFGWAQMESHGDLILRLYGEARGRAAEYWGEPQLASDRWVRTNGIPERARAWYEAQKPQFRSYLDAFAAGMNAYAQAHPDRIAAEVKPVLPVTPADVLAHTARVIYYQFVINEQRVMADLLPGAMPGSNAWALAPKRTAAGHALLLANPHLPWSGYFLFYEGQLSAPGIDAYGATLVGFPVMGIAFNDALGWTHTVNTNDSADLYELTPAEGGYRWDGGVRAFDTETQTLRVKQRDGSLREEKLLVRRSVQGPVVGERNGKPIALRVAGLDQPGLCEEWWDMARAKSLREFEAALRRLQIPMFNVIYADREGHILYVFNARVPVRPAGNYNWAGIVPGDTSKTLWTRTHLYEDLPRVLDPPGGWLQNTNDPPWTCTFPMLLDPDKFPPYLAPRLMGFRTQRSVRMLDGEPRMTLAKLVESKHSTRMELADRVLDELLAAARKRGGATLMKAVAVLEKWDRAADGESRGAVLFEQWARRWWRGPASFAAPWNFANPRETPRGLADPVTAAAALEEAAREVEKRYGAMDVAYGDVFRLRRGDLDLPGNGGPGDPLGIFRVIGYGPAGDGKFQANGGDSYVAAVEFSRPVRAMALVGYGNASQPGSKHLQDQLPFASRKQLRPVWRARQEIDAHLERKERL